MVKDDERQQKVRASASEKLERGAIDEIEYEEITGVLDLVTQRMRSAGDAATEKMRDAVEGINRISKSVPQR
jgi:hypothetical protein